MVQLFYYCNLNHTSSIRLNWYTLTHQCKSLRCEDTYPDKFIG